MNAAIEQVPDPRAEAEQRLADARAKHADLEAHAAKFPPAIRRAEQAVDAARRDLTARSEAEKAALDADLAARARHVLDGTPTGDAAEAYTAARRARREAGDTYEDAAAVLARLKADADEASRKANGARLYLDACIDEVLRVEMLEAVAALVDAEETVETVRERAAALSIIRPQAIPEGMRKLLTIPPLGCERWRYVDEMYRERGPHRGRLDAHGAEWGRRIASLRSGKE